jgi:CDP-diacylglycerol--glycerol-3-phosphate 3-phosphatidyltransferase
MSTDVAARPARTTTEREQPISTHTEDLELPLRPLRQRIADGVRVGVGPVIRLLVRLGVGPNSLTLIGFAGAIATCVLVVQRHWLAAGFVFAIGSFMDLFDGSVARLSGKVSEFGAFLDSTLDRTAEGLVLGAIGVTLARDGHWWALGACFLALTASFLVSYTRARAEGLGVDSNRGGLMSRPERIVLTAAAIFFAPIDHVTEVVIYALAALTVLTVAQRVVYVWRALRHSDAVH